MSQALTAVSAAVPLAAGWTVHGLWQRHLIDRAERDALTGLPRRAAFEKRAARMLRRTRTGLVAVLVIDLDGFKQVNDIHGHAAGDTAIREIGRRLAQWAEPLGIVARLGGDEFAAVIRCADADTLRGELTHLHQWLCSTVTYQGLPLALGASIGVHSRRASRRTVHLPAALRAADEAMYQVKQDGGGWTVTHCVIPAYKTVNGRRDGRPGTSNEEPMSARDDRDDCNPFAEVEDYDDFEDEEFEDAEEWQPHTGRCDHCAMAPGEVIEPLGLCCACWLGQGADPEHCGCGPRDDDGGEVER